MTKSHIHLRILALPKHPRSSGYSPGSDPDERGDHWRHETCFYLAGTAVLFSDWTMRSEYPRILTRPVSVFRSCIAACMPLGATESGEGGTSSCQPQPCILWGTAASPLLPEEADASHMSHSKKQLVLRGQSFMDRNNEMIAAFDSVTLPPATKLHS